MAISVNNLIRVLDKHQQAAADTNNNYHQDTYKRLREIAEKKPSYHDLQAQVKTELAKYDPKQPNTYWLNQLLFELAAHMSSTPLKLLCPQFIGKKIKEHDFDKLQPHQFFGLQSGKALENEYGHEIRASNYAIEQDDLALFEFLESQAEIQKTHISEIPYKTFRGDKLGMAIYHGSVNILRTYSRGDIKVQGYTKEIGEKQDPAYCRLLSNAAKQQQSKMIAFLLDELGLCVEEGDKVVSSAVYNATKDFILGDDTASIVILDKLLDSRPWFDERNLIDCLLESANNIVVQLEADGEWRLFKLTTTPVAKALADDMKVHDIKNRLQEYLYNTISKLIAAGVDPHVLFHRVVESKLSIAIQAFPLELLDPNHQYIFGHTDKAHILFLALRYCYDDITYMLLTLSSDVDSLIYETNQKSYYALDTIVARDDLTPDARTKQAKLLIKFGAHKYHAKEFQDFDNRLSQEEKNAHSEFFKVVGSVQNKQNYPDAYVAQVVHDVGQAISSSLSNPATN